MSYDLYVELGGESEKDVAALTNGTHRGVTIDVSTCIRLLTGIAAYNNRVKDYAVSGDRKQGGGYKSLVHAQKAEESPYAKKLILPEHARLDKLGLLSPTAPELRVFPLGSWFLQFTFTLAKPWISKDDDPFYVADSINPVRKDKVFKVPMMSASSWKGVLRWTIMHTCLALKKNDLDNKAFAAERLAQTLLFGDEKGEEPGRTKDFAGFLDQMKLDARSVYAQLLRKHFRVTEDKPLPHHAGRLCFFPTFFNLIDVEVINPHSRETKAGTHPIYLECVPINAKGTFSLLYVPFDLIGQSENDVRAQAMEDLLLVAQGIQAMLTKYGFGAKTSSGFGVANIGKGQFQVAMPDPNEKSKPDAVPSEETISAQVTAFMQRFGLDEFPRWTNPELKASSWGRKRQSGYKRLRQQHPDWDAATRTWRSEVTPETPSAAEPQETPLTSRKFKGWVNMEQQISHLRQGKEERNE